jgi:hypothetical protein
VPDLPREGGSNEVHRSPVLRRVGFDNLRACNQLTEANKEEELVDEAPGWG